MKTVKDILEQKGDDIISIGAEEPLSMVIMKLTQHKIGALPVLSENGTIQGIISERDIIRYLSGKVDISLADKVADLMTKEVTYVKPHQSIEECLQLMTSGRFRHLPVVSGEKCSEECKENCIMTGIISIGDVVKAMLTKLNLKIGELEYYIANTY